MDSSETYVDVKFTQPYPRSPSLEALNSTYSELSFGTGGPFIDEEVYPPVVSGPEELPITAQTDGLNSIYTVLNHPKDEQLMEEYEDVPVASRPAEMSMAAQADPHKQEPNENIGDRPNCLICLLCLVTFVLFLTVVGLSIHVSRIRQAKEICHRTSNELNSTLQSKISENSHLDLSQRTCLKNLSALNSNLPDLKRMHSDLRHQFTEMETKYRSVNETKAQICELLTCRREQPCSQDWIRNEDRFYFISTFTMPYSAAEELCSHSDSKLLEINSTEEEKFVNKAVGDQDSSFWIGTCKDGEMASNVVFKVNAGSFECGECKSPRSRSCKDDLHRYICQKPVLSCPDIPENIRDLCQKSVEPT